MVDTLVSGASASRRVGSTPIIRTKNPHDLLIMRIFLQQLYLDLSIQLGYLSENLMT